MSFMRNIQLINKSYNNFLGKLSPKYLLTTAEMRILVFLNDNEGLDLSKDISEILMVAKSYISGGVNSLIEKHYIEKIQDSNDKKKYHLKITKDAQKVVDDLEKDLAKFREEVFEGLSEKDVEFVKVILDKATHNAVNLC